jgi:hypothetical protein
MVLLKALPYAIDYHGCIANQKQNHTTHTSNTMFIDFVGVTYSCRGGGLLVPLGVFERRTGRLASCGGVAATGGQG